MSPLVEQARTGSHVSLPLLPVERMSAKSRGFVPRLKETGRWPLYDSWVRYVNEGLRRMYERRQRA